MYKIALIGDGSVGKSTFKSFLSDIENFNFLNYRKHIPTNFEKNLKENITKLNLFNEVYEILDCPGQSPCFEQTEKLCYSCDAVIVIYDKNILQTKLNVIEKWLPMIENINKNRIKKIPVAIIGNKSDTGGKHTLRYAQCKYYNFNFSLFTMSLRDEICEQYDNSIYSKWKESKKQKLQSTLLLPLQFLKENI